MLRSDWHVLIIEDEADSMELVQGILDYFGIQTTGATTAVDGLAALQSIQPTLILIDLKLPGMDGWTLLKELRRISVNAPCLAMTAYHSPELANKAIAAGFKAFFAKPIDANSFVGDLETIVNYQ